VILPFLTLPPLERIFSIYRVSRVASYTLDLRRIWGRDVFSTFSPRQTSAFKVLKIPPDTINVALKKQTPAILLLV